MTSPTPRPERPPATLSDVRDGIAKLCRDIGSLQGEVNELRNLIGRFAKGRTLAPYIYGGPEIDRFKGERAQTPEPKSQILEALELLKSADTVQEQSLLLKAISRDLDGALRDIRAAKLDVRGITDDSDLRAEFKAWKEF